MTHTFLYHVASALLQRYGTDMSRLTVVFPNRRASLFLEQELSQLSEAPVWAPRFRTISDLFHQASPYVVPDRIETICRLHRCYARHVDEAWTLDSFYSWGEVLLSDFDEVDKHMVSPRAIFTNIADLRQLDDTDYITPEQEEALSRFFADFSLEHTSEIKQRFLQLWSKMADIHADLCDELRADGLLYEGALQRDVVERMQRGERLLPEGDYAFVGFNVLSKTEKTLFDILDHSGQASFFWDYDRFYAASHEAGTFVMDNIRRYGNALPPEIFDNLSSPPDITIGAAATDNAQARYLPDWLTQHLDHEHENHTAIVLADESLLQPVLHSIPTGKHLGAPKTLNVTMGYPLRDTPVYSFVESMMHLQTDGYDARYNRLRPALLRVLLRHPYAKMVRPETLQRHAPLLVYLLEALAELSAALAEDGDILQREAVFQAFTALTRLRDLSQGDNPLLIVEQDTMRRLVRQVLQARTIPFHGEPATGLQVMGLLETRTLDFDNVIILSTGEGTLPDASPDASFIPYNIRAAFGLTTLREKLSVYAYYFFRLLQRARHVTLLYNESNVGVRQHEISRFIRQLQAETQWPLRHIRLQALTQPSLEVQTIEMPKTELAFGGPTSPTENEQGDGHSRVLALSPTALNTYTECPLKFYYRYVRNISIQPDPEDGLDAILFGNVFHRAAELFYQPFLQQRRIVTAHDLEPYLQQGGQLLEPIVRQAFRDEYFSKAKAADGRVVGMPEVYQGILLIAFDVVKTYLQTLLRADSQLPQLKILGLECRRYTEMDITLPPTASLPERHVKIRTGGIIDRLDEIDHPDGSGRRLVRIVDYKTGGTPANIPALDNLFVRTGQYQHYVFQTMLYAGIIAESQTSPVAPCLFFVHRAATDEYTPYITLDKKQLLDIREYRDGFDERLRQLVADIFNPDLPYTQTTELAPCKHCDFRRLCGR